MNCMKNFSVANSQYTLFIAPRKLSVLRWHVLYHATVPEVSIIWTLLSCKCATSQKEEREGNRKKREI